MVPLNQSPEHDMTHVDHRLSNIEGVIRQPPNDSPNDSGRSTAARALADRSHEDTALSFKSLAVLRNANGAWTHGLTRMHEPPQSPALVCISISNVLQWVASGDLGFSLSKQCKLSASCGTRGRSRVGPNGSS